MADFVMTLLEQIKSPSDLKALSKDQLPQLAEEVRARLIESCSITGGHIGASLGVVELAIALLYEFDSPKDKVLWDVGHQAYAWKLLTGRNDQFETLRQEGGISGFLKRSENPHDQFGAGHAGTAMSAAFGVATARDLQGDDFKVVAVVGDGAFTCGLTYEGMNNAGHSDRDVILILNDNGMSISPNVGAVSKMLGGIVADPKTNKVVWEYDTAAAPVATVSGKMAQGGVMDGAGPTVADGVVYVSSGYQGRSGQPGIVLMAFSVDGR